MVCVYHIPIFQKASKKAQLAPGDCSRGRLPAVGAGSRLEDESNVHSERDCGIRNGLAWETRLFQNAKHQNTKTPKHTNAKDRVDIAAFPEPKSTAGKNESHPPTTQMVSCIHQQLKRRLRIGRHKWDISAIIVRSIQAWLQTHLSFLSSRPG